MPFVNVPSTESANYINAQKNEWQDTYYVDNLNTLGAGGGGGGGGDVSLLFADSGIAGASPFAVDDIFNSDYRDYRIVIRYKASGPMNNEAISFRWADNGVFDNGSWTGIYVYNSSGSPMGSSYMSTTLDLSQSSSGMNWSSCIIDLTFGGTIADPNGASVHVDTTMVTGGAAVYTSNGYCSSGGIVTTATGIGIASSYGGNVDVNVSVYGYNNILAP